MKNPVVVLSVVLAGLTLSGCQSPLLAGWGFTKKSPESGAFARTAAEPLVALEEGRIFLRNGQISSAVASFKIAQLDPVAAPDAKNGLGVAYVKLGRPDIADRYFREALALRPGEDRYAANLLRLQRDVMLARASTEGQGAGQAEVPAEVATAANGLLAQAEPQARLARARTPVLRITTGERSAAAPSIQVVARTVSTGANLPAVASREAGSQSLQPVPSAAKPREVVF